MTVLVGRIEDVAMRSVVIVAALATAAVCSCSYMRHPTEATEWGRPAGTMVLGIEARGDVVNAFIENRGALPQKIIAKGITLTITSQGAAGSDGKPEVVKIVDSNVILLDRDDTFDTLQPGQSLATPINVSQLHAGTYTVVASYNDRKQSQTGDWWQGTLSAGPITIQRP